MLRFSLLQLQYHGKRGTNKKASTKRVAVWTVTNNTCQETDSSSEDDYEEDEEVSESGSEERNEQDEDSSSSISDYEKGLTHSNNHFVDIFY